MLGQVILEVVRASAVSVIDTWEKGHTSGSFVRFHHFSRVSSREVILQALFGERKIDRSESSWVGHRLGLTAKGKRKRLSRCTLGCFFGRFTFVTILEE